MSPNPDPSPEDLARHSQKMKKLKVARDRLMETKIVEKGLEQPYTFSIYDAAGVEGSK